MVEHQSAESKGSIPHEESNFSFFVPWEDEKHLSLNRMVVYHRLPLTPNPFSPRNDQKPNFPQQYPDNFKQKCNENINLEILFDSQMVLRSKIQINI